MRHDWPPEKYVGKPDCQFAIIEEFIDNLWLISEVLNNVLVKAFLLFSAREMEPPATYFL